jgi:hypothetical protein
MNETNMKNAKKTTDWSNKKNKAMTILMVIHLFAYAAVQALLVLFFFLSMGLTGITFFWPIYPILGWGIGVGIHAFIYGIYYEKTPFLAKLKEESLFKILFFFHAWIYLMANLIVLFGNLSTLGLVNVIYFYWPIILWGIALGYHGIGYIFWDKKVAKEIASIKRKKADINDKKARKLAAFKVVNTLILLAHITYYIVAQVIIFILFVPLDMAEQLLDSTHWGILLIIHLLSYYVFFYRENIEEVKKGVIIHAAFYVGYNTINFARSLFFPPIDTLSPFFTLLFWGIFLAFHAYIALNYQELQEQAESTLKAKSIDVEKEELESKIKPFVTWKWTFLGHVAIYIVGLIVLTVTILVLGMDLLLVPIIALGWLIAISAHYSLYWILMFRVKSVLEWSFKIHLHVYVPSCILMIVLNLISGIFPWSLIGILGWGIAIGIHYILKRYITIK